MRELSVFDVQNALKVHQKIGHDINGGGRTAIIDGQPYGMVLARKLYILQHPPTLSETRLATHIMQAEKPVVSKVTSTASTMDPLQRNVGLGDDEPRTRQDTHYFLEARPFFPSITAVTEKGDEEHFFDTGHAQENARGSNVSLVTHIKKLHHYSGTDFPHGTWAHGRSENWPSSGYNADIHDVLRNHTQIDKPTLGLRYGLDDDDETLPITAENLRNFNIAQALDTLTSPTQLGSGLVHVQHRIYIPNNNDRRLRDVVDTHYLYDPQSESLNRVEMPPARNWVHDEGRSASMRW